ncbi:MAG: 23S rRNA (guanosine(2251)-2'-O)-methyltransferase RlmB [Rhodospirillaceae bacterium]|nr:23S rRNA (guanosine(2251)-2'-O)-methyltransferase RlmB [Rhodospirillaceae bacterium]
MSQIEHVLKKSAMYIGDTKPRTELEWIYDLKSNKMIKKEITFSPGLFKLFDEILVNAIDESTRDKTLNEIKVNIDKDTISVYNNGIGIDVVMHPEHKVWVPELIFANLLTSTNYNDNEERVTGGTHGLGAKLTAIFSKKVIIEIGDSKNKKQYYQEYKNNLSEISKPVIKKYNEKTGYVKITFIPDYKRFDYDKLDEDNKNMMLKRVYDTAALTPNYLKVFLNTALAANQVPVFLALDHIQDPHNLGACIRTAEAAGVDGVIVSKNQTAPLTEVARKVASGAAETLPIYRVANLVRALEQLKKEGVWVLGSSDKADQNIYQSKLQGALCFVMGSEGTGLKSFTAQVCDEMISIPMRGSVSSVNVSVATGIVLFEWLRQSGLSSSN